MVSRRSAFALVCTSSCLAWGVNLATGANEVRAAVVRAPEVQNCDDNGCWYSRVVEFRAGRGEANVVGVRKAGREVIVRDRRARVHAVAPCKRISVHAASCRTSGSSLPAVWIWTGDGDDRLAVSPTLWPHVYVHASMGAGADTASMGRGGGVDGGPGPDRLVVRAGNFVDPQGQVVGSAAGAYGDDGDDILIAASGHTALVGGAGDDVLHGGPGDDDLDPGMGSDTVDGGAGTDWLDYAPATAVRVDLRSGRASTFHGRATVTRVENVSTGQGDDVLIGDDAANQLIAGSGRNTIRAGGGADVIEDLAAGSSCGRGRDTVLVPAFYESRATSFAELRMPVPADCERARIDGHAILDTSLDVRPEVAAQQVTFTGVRTRDPHQIVWELRSGPGAAAPLLGQVDTKQARGRVTLTLNARGIACVARPGCHAVLSLQEPRVDDEGGIRSDPERSLPLPLALTPD